MAKVQYADAIKVVSGALTKINKKSPHAADQKMVLATHRTAETTSKSCSRLYLRGLSSITRSTPIKTEERAARNRFGSVAAAVNTRMHDLSKVTADQAAFLAQKDQPNGKKTMRAYLWRLELQAYDEQHS